MQNIAGTLLFFLVPLLGLAQEPEVISIHRYESERYEGLKKSGRQVFDSLSGYRSMQPVQKEYAPLTRRVFGYHPYWGGSNYLNYQWELLSDFCHFSYEVDPSTGLPLTTHDWESSPAIDSALAHGVRVHLCVTLFSGHGTFFSNPEATQTLIGQVIQLISDRGAHGINIDVEALPSVYKDEFLAFMIDLCGQAAQQIPDAEVSIAAPAVNWSEKFNIPVLNQYLDFFMVMGYDYYWSGSAQAGPVSPLYPMTGYYTYSFSRTISYYQAQGVGSGKLIMGVPYYAYQWATEGQYAPSATLGPAAAYTYRYIRDHATGYYSPANKHLESNSFGPYFSFESNGWNQCFIEDTYSLGEKYDIINRRDLAGIGIWALGYDNGYQELWDLVAAKFTGDAVPVHADTLYDSGGPAFDYYDDEAYTYTLTASEGSTLYLSFTCLDTEANYDTLWIHDGPDVSFPLMGVFTGDSIPTLLQSSSNCLTLRFYSDGATVDAGWRAVYDTVQVSGYHDRKHVVEVPLRPNPAQGVFWVGIPEGITPGDLWLRIIDIRGVVYEEMSIIPGHTSLALDAAGWGPGNYIALIYKNGKAVARSRFIIR